MSAARVLVIEDNHMNLKLVRTLLTIAKIEVLSATNAEDGLKLALAELPDLILMDIHLPGMDGLSATKALKSRAETAAIPVVALTACAMSGDGDKMQGAGCDGYIPKPINTRTFVEQVREFLPDGVE